MVQSFVPDDDASGSAQDHQGRLTHPNQVAIDLAGQSRGFQDRSNDVDRIIWVTDPGANDLREVELM